MNGKEYPVGTLAEMAAIPEEARGRFLAEFPSMLAEMAKSLEIYAAFNAAAEGLATMTALTPIWIDDEKNEISHTIRDLNGLEVKIKRKRNTSEDNK